MLGIYSSTIVEKGLDVLQNVAIAYFSVNLAQRWWTHTSRHIRVRCDMDEQVVKILLSVLLAIVSGDSIGNVLSQKYLNESTAKRSWRGSRKSSWRQCGRQR